MKETHRLKISVVILDFINPTGQCLESRRRRKGKGREKEGRFEHYNLCLKSGRRETKRRLSGSTRSRPFCCATLTGVYQVR